ncbi:MAG: hypothetical protein ACKOQ0_05990 [Solirubrobacterales bacterium]
MEILAAICVIALLGVTVLFVGAPLRRRAAGTGGSLEGRIADLEAARDARYREIRELEIDHRTGKLDDQDWRRLDRELRAEAIEILRELDELRPQGAEPPASR